MLIDKISLYNYRLYQGLNTINFGFDDKKNIFIISGENGFGKTTFLHSLLWCLYGRLASDIEDTLRKEIQNGGYSTLLKTNLNNAQATKLASLSPDVISHIKKRGYQPDTDFIKAISQYYVEITFSEIAIPSIPCSSLIIKRSYDAILEKEFVEILIDGKPNELATVIGPEIFINDFILNKDVARFFFFDSEQIVALAETGTSAERKKLCSAYNEVLGVSKYEDLKNNLDSVRVRFRRRSSDVAAHNKIALLTQKQEAIESEIASAKSRIDVIDSEISSFKLEDEELQLQLVREGNSATIEEIKRLKALIETAQRKSSEYKQLLKTYLDYAPLAICGKLLMETKKRIEHDFAIASINTTSASKNALISDITSELFLMLHKLNLEESVRMEVQDRMQGVLEHYRVKSSSDATLFDISDADYKEFESVINYILSTYRAEFERLADDYKKNKQILERNSRRLSNIESKERDSLIQSLREKKNRIEARIETLNAELRDLLGFIGTKNQELATIKKQLSRLLKNVDLDDLDSKKDALAEELSAELSSFLALLKDEKKFSLERRIKTILNSLMHKDDFIHRVEVNINTDEMDINLFGADDNLINKDVLSKGEQQLYATSILKALVDESGIQFPVFIDSPLQKFDKTHASKIISEFYPRISKQVVIFPLLYKEITSAELELMKPYVNSAYIIANEVSHSSFETVDVNLLMSTANV